MMNDYQETVSRLQELKLKAAEMRDDRIRTEAQLANAVKMRQEVFAKLTEQGLNEKSAEEKIAKTTTAINAALDKIEQFLGKRG